MGSQFAPVLCSAVALQREWNYHLSFSPFTWDRSLHLSAFWLLLWDVTANSLLRSMRTWHSRSGVRTILIFFSTLDFAIIH